MPVHSGAVGEELDSHESEISLRQTLAYAAGIGDVSPATFEADRSGGVMASPSFCVSLEWPVVSGRRAAEILGAAPEERRRSVHAAQDSTFYRPIRPGDRLLTTGRVVAVRPLRAGTLCLMRLETVDQISGDAVTTSYSTSIYRGVTVEGEVRVEDEAPVVPSYELTGRSERVEIPISRQMPHIYTECARIWNPIHTERTVALAAGLPDIILHGTATWALAGREIVARYCDHRPERLRRLHGRFRAMVIPGTTVILEHELKDSGTVRFLVRNHEGEAAITEGLAEVA